MYKLIGYRARFLTFFVLGLMNEGITSYRNNFAMAKRIHGEE